MSEIRNVRGHNDERIENMNNNSKLMAPLWLKYPHIRRGSIGWRMGYGEAYAMEYYLWQKGLDKEFWEEYKLLFPEPINWLGWYDNKYLEHEYTYNIDWLKAMNQNNEYIFFWGHQPSNDGVMTKSCFSQWWKSDFKVGHINYSCMEQYMMAEKARLFKDIEIEEKILASSSSKEMKELGRKVNNFNEEIWNMNKYNIVVEGNYYKFVQQSSLKKYLLNTDNKVIVEASPYDKVWGIGLREGEKGIFDPINWKGENLLGFALMEVRDIIKRTSANEKLVAI
ncbi:NADAR family protein [Vallitalea maricola]|uniref:Uncharacterized protein n=1 Tax=Vallitalea maricola TaxID=3074433 RepID=A0ACB5UQ61_9FIRM|nr:hypothetical protein AN2V17_38910 [Vallitalea sp. AN17-2]